MIGLGAADLLELVLVDEPVSDPMGRRIAWTQWTLDAVADQRVCRVVVHDTAGGHRVTVTPEARGASWSADGTRLAAVAAGPGATGLLIVDPASGASRPLAAGAGAVTEPAWSPVADLIACTGIVDDPVLDDDGWHLGGPGYRIDGVPGLVRRRRRVRLVGLDGRVADLWDGPTETWSPSWAPDGSRLAVLAGGPAGTELWHGAPGAPPTRWAPLDGSVRAACWAPDGRALACLVAPEHRADRHLRLYLVELNGSVREFDRTGLDRRIALGLAVRADDPRATGQPALCWSERTGRVYVEATVAGRGPLCWFDRSGGAGLLLDGELACLSPAVAGDRVAVVLTDDADPGDVYLLDDSSGTAERLSRSNPWLTGRTAQTLALAVPGPVGTVDAWVAAPVGVRGPLPTVVSVHGGPHYAVGHRFTAETHRLAAQGLAVLTLNPRGSLGQGEEYALALRGDWGGVDTTDVHAAIDAAVATGLVDPERLGITGVSYGGFLTQWLLASGNRFRAGISENGICDFVALWGSGAGDPEGWDLSMDGPPWTSPRYAQRSPLLRADRITAPLLLVHAEDDQVCPVAQSEQMFAALSRLGGEVAFVRIPGEGHLMNLLGRPSRRLRRAAAVDSWWHARLIDGRADGRPLMPAIS